MVDVRANGQISDGGVLYYTKFWEKLQNNTFNIPPPSCLPNTEEQFPYVFLGNEVFTLQPFLMKPYSQQDLTNEHRIFNYRLSRGRQTVKNAFGILASRFGVFQKPINLGPEKAASISFTLATLACCYLQKFLIETKQNLNCLKNVLIEENTQTGEIENDSEVTGNLLTF